MRKGAVLVSLRLWVTLEMYKAGLILFVPPGLLLAWLQRAGNMVYLGDLRPARALASVCPGAAVFIL